MGMGLRTEMGDRMEVPLVQVRAVVEQGQGWYRQRRGLEG